MVHELKLNGDSHTLRFNIGTLDHLRQLSESFPDAFKVSTDSPWGVIDQVKAIVIAALRSQWDYVGQQYALTVEQINKGVMNLDYEDAARVLEVYATSYASKAQTNGHAEPGEVKAQVVTKN